MMTLHFEELKFHLENRAKRNDALIKNGTHNLMLKKNVTYLRVTNFFLS